MKAVQAVSSSCKGGAFCSKIFHCIKNLARLPFIVMATPKIFTWQIFTKLRYSFSHAVTLKMHKLMEVACYRFQTLFNTRIGLLISALMKLRLCMVMHKYMKMW